MPKDSLAITLKNGSLRNCLNEANGARQIKL